MTKTVNLYEAKTHLSRLVERAAQVEEIVIAKAGKPRARLVPLRETAAPREPANLLRVQLYRRWSVTRRGSVGVRGGSVRLPIDAHMGLAGGDCRTIDRAVRVTARNEDGGRP